MKKRVPLYELIDKLDSKEKIFIRKYISNNLNTSSKLRYLDFYDQLLKTKKLNDEEILRKLSKNKLRNYLSEAKFYLNKLIVKALRIHYSLNYKNNNKYEDFLFNLERQKEIYIYFSKGLFKDAAQLCNKYKKDWEEKEDFAMLLFVYKIMHQIELLTGSNKVKNNRYFELYTQLLQSDIEKSKYINLSNEIVNNFQKIEIARTNTDVELFKSYLKSEIMLNPVKTNIYYYYNQILCHYAVLNFDNLPYYFEKLYKELESPETNSNKDVSKLLLVNRVTYIIVTSNNNYYFQYKNYYFKMVLNSAFLSNKLNTISILNSKIMESLYLFKQKRYYDMLKIDMPKLNIENYIFEGRIVLYYTELLFARGKANFELGTFEKALNYFIFILNYKKRLGAKAFLVCNSYFHIWLIKYISKEYKVLPSITNRFKIFLNTQKINFSLEKILLKFMNTCSNNSKKENVQKNVGKLVLSLESLSVQPIEKHLITKLNILAFLKKLVR